MPDSSQPIAIIGGGPAGSIAALCLRHLNREVEVFEKSKFPRYSIGEGLLPGTFSILSRLGLQEEIEKIGFSRKAAATFLWGANKEPWTFSLATPKPQPWIFDHAYQVERADFDKLLLDTARERGAIVHEECEVTAVSAETGQVSWRNGSDSGTTESPWIIDGSGRRGIVAKASGLRQFDPYFKNMALWSYFKGGKRFGGDLEGNPFSVATNDGWIWIIPLRDDIYSVGIVTDESITKRIKESNLEIVFEELLAECEFTQDVLADSERCDKVRATRDWAYEASQYAVDRAFLCGDSACFIDPLFSQGVHLAAYSAVLASSAIDYLLDNPAETSKVQEWYDQSYRHAYNGYHEFLSAIYAYNRDRPSEFWKTRSILDNRDDRFNGKPWFDSSADSGSGQAAEDLASRGRTLRKLWHHASGLLTDDFDETELSLRRLKWAGDRMKEFQRLKSVRWSSETVDLAPTFKVNPLSFKLEKTVLLRDEAGNLFRGFSASEELRQVLESSRSGGFTFRELARELKQAGGEGIPMQVVSEMLEQGFLTGYNSEDQPIVVENPLRFRGVGAKDSLD
jgi:flavin-dependent dehydrogenase